jgi:cytochrome c553
LIFGCLAIASLATAQQRPLYPVPDGFEGSQFQPPYHTKNPFTAEELARIDNGFLTFTTEDFDGNGRTCKTCHEPGRSYNISSDDIAKLSAADRALVLGGTNGVLENEEAVLELALFNIDQDAGCGHEGNIETPEGPFRSSMTIGGVAFTTLNYHVCRPGIPTPGGTECVPGFNGLPFNNLIVDDGIRDIMLGWSGEGPLDEMFPFVEPDPMLTMSANCEAIIEKFNPDHANPDLVSLRNLDLALATFSLAAVKTHFPLTLNRQPGVDFRCPTEDELLDMSIFQRWLGRRFELDIRELDFRAKDANKGRNLFSTRIATCVACHVSISHRISRTQRLARETLKVAAPS